ncbi:MAG: TOBE domain-containing protein, partial [Gemmatimonadales bacterium]|nr:TOBE domain-containing protein [Gemmatimonadales bacterium]
VEFVSYLGASLDVRVRLSSADRVIVQVANRHDGGSPRVGDHVHVGWSAAAGLVFAGDAAPPA